MINTMKAALISIKSTYWLLQFRNKMEAANLFWEQCPLMAEKCEEMMDF